tara:strand:- start:90 stop:737 length:648 start_codon:yes stop_codon:yes gene_type:complete
MKNTKFNNDKELQFAWNELSESKNYTLKKDFIINSINSKSILSIMEIKTKIKNALIMQIVAFSILLYLSITGILHTSKHVENDSSSAFFVMFLIFVLSFHSFLIIRQFWTFLKLKKWKINTNSTIKQLTDNYTVIKSYLNFDKYWSSFTIFVGTYLIFSSYAHHGNHNFSMAHILLISIISFAISFYIIAIKNKRKYGKELDKLRQIINDTESLN